MAGAVEQPAHRMRLGTARNDRGATGMGCDLRCLELGVHAAAAHTACGVARHAEMFVADRVDDLEESRLVVRARISVVEAVDIRQQHEEIGHHGLCNARGQSIVVAVAQLVGRDRVVLVHDRHDTMLEQLLERAAGVEESSFDLGVVGRQQNLCGLDVVTTQRFLVGMHELHLPGRGAGLQTLEAGPAPIDAERSRAQRNGTGRHDNHLAGVRPQRGNVVREGIQPAAIQPIVGVDQQRGTDLDD